MFGGHNIRLEDTYRGCKNGAAARLDRFYMDREQEDIAALQDDSGVVHTARSKCADMAMKFWAGISSQPETNAEARAQVLAALAADSLPQI
ncbi:hypothetical protein KSW81_008406 [Nannochloris sp. 'desiccata']|nr:hypothetical protein KSW81_008406 [Chlorella desiccata (nom. nud.)]